MKPSEWTTYRTRFLVKAKQLSSALSFVDHLGRQHCGRKGDYLVESSDGVLSIAPRQIFEDIYVPMSPPDDSGDEAATTSSPKMDRPNFEPLEISTVQLSKPATDCQPVEEPRALARHDGARVRRKLPQPFRDRRGSVPRLRLM